MKRCPACNQTYADDALSFCMNDGTALVRAASSFDPQATIMSPPPSVTEPQPPPQSFNDAGSSGWNAPPSYSPPQSRSNPGAWQPPPPPNPMQSVPPAGMAQVGRQQPHPLAIVSLICGLISITFGLICGGLPLGVIAIILGVIALFLIRNDPRRFSGKGFAIAGIAIGALWGVFTIFWLLIAILGAIKR